MKEIKTLLVKLATYYEKTLTPEQIQIYSEQLFKHLSADELSAACASYIDNPKNEFFPRPVSKLIEIIKKPVDDVDLSVAIAGRVVEAISKFGWANEREAMEFIGSAGEEAVKRFGGWKYVCENLGTEMSLTTFQAQCRDGVKANLRIVRAGETVPQLETRMKNVLIDFKIKELK